MHPYSLPALGTGSGPRKKLQMIRGWEGPGSDSWRSPKLTRGSSKGERSAGRSLKALSTTAGPLRSWGNAVYTVARRRADLEGLTRAKPALPERPQPPPATPAAGRFPPSRWRRRRRQGRGDASAPAAARRGEESLPRPSVPGGAPKGRCACALLACLPACLPLISVLLALGPSYLDEHGSGEVEWDARRLGKLTEGHSWVD